METISLKKVTAIVTLCTIGSYLANANANETSSKSAEKNISVKAVNNSKNIAFAPLVKQFDVDNNGLLSAAEVKASKEKSLINHFSEIDLNTDAGISEAEYNQYIKQAK